MKHITFLYSDTIATNDARKKAQKKCYKEQLVQIFTSESKKKNLTKILYRLRELFPKAHIIGTTTAGEISQGKMYDNETIISLSLFEKTQLQLSYVDTIDKKHGKKFSTNLTQKYAKAAIVLSEGLLGEDYEGFIQGIKEKNPKLIISGGLAGDNFKLKKTFIFYEDQVYSKGAVGVSFSGENLYANNTYNLNLTPIGKKFTISSSTGNIVHAIDGIGAKELFIKYFGDDIFTNYKQALPDFQLLYKEGNTVVARTPLAVEGESLVFAGALKEGQEVQFGFLNTSEIFNSSNKLSKKIDKHPAEAIYFYSCIVRKILLGKELEKEFSSFERIAPTAGFFTYGEFYSTTKNNAILNCTTTMLVLSENSKQKKKQRKEGKKQEIEESKKNLNNTILDALTNFIQETSLELQKNVELLEQYKKVVDATSLISKTDKDGIITYVNDKFCTKSKYLQTELIGKNHNIIRDKSLSDAVFKDMLRSIQKGKVWKGLLSNRAKDGSIYYTDSSILPMVNAQNQIQEYFSISQDVTKQVLANKKVKEKEKLIKAIFDNQDSIVIYASPKKGMISVNQKLFEYLNYKNLEAFKKKHTCICDIFLEEEGYTNPKKYPNWIDDIANHTAETNKAKIRIKDGSVHTFNLIIKKINGEYIINLYDITSFEEALMKAHSSEQAKSMFLSNMSHEIRTPLNGILGFTDILTKKDLDKDIKKYIDIIHSSGKTLLNIVNDILDFSKIGSGELTLYKAETNLFVDMEAVVATFASVARQKHIEYYTYIDPNIPKKVLCDTQRIKQVMNNLISNAMKFTPSHGSVDLSIHLKKTTNKQAKILFSIKDSGIGIDEEKLPTIFKAFSQADNSISREFGGTGLGLAISNKYINMMGSSIQVQSKKGEGSRFSFVIELPIVDASPSLVKRSNVENLSINVLYPTNEVECAINANISTYIEAWGCHYKEVYDFREINESCDVFILCAKLFDKKTCLNLLKEFPKLQLIFIEGSEEEFNCEHERFHLLEQPLTGSALFDKLISFATTHVPLKEDSTQEETPQYQGRVLVAEDNATNQMLISIMLEERGIDFSIVENGQEAVDALNSDEKYSLTLMDINMPILDGLSAVKILREQNYKGSIVSLSANVIESDIKTYLEAGVNETLNKPLVPQELDAVLKKYLQKQKNSQNDAMVFDTVNIDRISKELSIPSSTIVKKLLASFQRSAKDIIQKLESKGLDAELVHNIKGISGNLRFHTLYKLISGYENELSQWSREEEKSSRAIVIKHLQNLIDQIESLNK